MVDEVDRAQALEQAHRDQAHRIRCLRLFGPRAQITQTGTDCLHCGDPIDFVRRAVQPGCAFCVFCQEKLEGARR